IDRRRAAALVVASCAALLATACGSSSSSSSSSSGSAAASSSSCHPAHQVHTLSNGVLAVSVYSYPPYGYESGGKLAGVDGAIINEIAALECLKVQPVPVAAAAAIPDVQTGRADTAMG